MERTVQKAISKNVVKVTEDLELLVAIDIGMHNVKAAYRDLEGNLNYLIMSSEVEQGESLTGHTTLINGEKWNLSENGDAKIKVGINEDDEEEMEEEIKEENTANENIEKEINNTVKEDFL